jgi:hypothetical protein
MSNDLLLVVLTHYITKIEEEITDCKRKEYARYIDELTNIFIGQSYVGE